MSGFSADWLALREPADHAVRSERVTRLIGQHLASARSGAIRVLDLGSGTGSNLRYLWSRLPAPQQWLLVDNDPGLLARAEAGGNRRRLEAEQSLAGSAVSTARRDLSVLDASLFTGRTLVTGSALLDLVSENWVRALVSHCRGAGAAALFALTYDGRIECSPPEPEDDRIRDLVNRHQQTNKGFGPALGPKAAEIAARCFAGQGYAIDRDRSDWVLDAAQADMQRQLIDGWAHAAIEIAPADASEIRDWQSRRLAHVAAGQSRLVVGHEDFGAIAAGVSGARL
jgi:hypothetical protein